MYRVVVLVNTNVVWEIQITRDGIIRTDVGGARLEASRLFSVPRRQQGNNTTKGRGSKSKSKCEVARVEVLLPRCMHTFLYMLLFKTGDGN
jgi:hypothetical protein